MHSPAERNIASSNLAFSSLFKKTNDDYLHKMVQIVYEAEDLIAYANQEEMILKLKSGL